MKRSIPAAFLTVFVVTSWFVSPAVSQERLTHVDLINRMIDLEHLAVLPDEGERGAMCASYDRRSRYDATSGKYVDWFANNDGPQFIRTEGDAVVLAEMEGPGVLWRIWSALAQSGHVKIYLDGAEKPVIDMPFEHYFDGKHAPFNYPRLSYQLEDLGCRGRNLYFPIPYQKSCKVVAEKGWGRYYQFTYLSLPEGTAVPTFRADLPPEAKAALERVDTFLHERLGTDPAAGRPGEQRLVKVVQPSAGETVCVADLAGPQAITAIRVNMDFGDREDEMAALRNLALQITWDGEQHPAVWCPLGDFFGTAPGVNHYKSLMTGMAKDGFYAIWYMPFAKRGVVELVNGSPRKREVRFEITHAPLDRPFEGLGHFHAKWHRDVFPVSEDRWPDWTLLKTEGRGRFCGAMLHVWNPRAGHHAESGEGHWWWGEGDEKFFVDGETFPSTFGTGSEDYFGYAWCDFHLFQRPYHNQTMTQKNAGHQTVSRWQIADNVPFQRSFEGYIEKYFPNERPTLYACVACWYLAPGGADPHRVVPAEQRHGYYARPDIVEGGFRVLGQAVGHITTQDMSKFEGEWKDDDQLWWSLANPGDTLTVEVPVESPGNCEVNVSLTKGRACGIVQFSLDGHKVGEPIDLHRAKVGSTGPVSLGTHQLSEGKHKLTVEMVGSNHPNPKQRYNFGLDQVLITPVR